MGVSYRRSTDVRRSQLQALAKGGQLLHLSDGKPSRTVFHDVAGNCQRPVRILDWGRSELKNGKTRVVTGSGNAANFMERDVPCRKCDNCLERRGYHWRLRAKLETTIAARTWMGTLTLDPTALVRSLTICRSAMHSQGLDYDALPYSDQFAQLDRLFYKEFQKRMKLLRKNTDAPLRYLAVTEAHKSGVPHWHVLLHEVDPDRPLRYDADLLGRQRVTVDGRRKWVKLRDPFWLAGFQHWDLKEAREASYVCKYLSKSLDAKVRASTRYGSVSDEPPPSKTEVNKGGAKRP